MSTIEAINIAGFPQVDGERVWTTDGQLGLVRNDDGTLSLLDADGVPCDYTLDDERAAHVLGRAFAYGDDAGAAARRWDKYAETL